MAAEDRGFFEDRLGLDFSGVRIHADAEAARAADALGARAFTIRQDVFCGAGEHAPGTNRWRWLLAHELTHVMQQAGGGAHGIQRKLRVEDPAGTLPGVPPRKNVEEIRDYIRKLASHFDVASGGAVTPASASVCASPTRVTDTCLCDLITAGNDWKIRIDDLDWPHTEKVNHRVTVHSTRSSVSFGAWGGGAHAGRRIEQGHPRVLGHELCGHAWLMERGAHPTGPPMVFSGGQVMGRPSHDPTVAIENVVANEMTPGAPRRGMFADPHHGESLAKVTVSGYATGSTDPTALSAGMRARLNRVRDTMVAQPLLRADIVGHTDPCGSVAQNNAVGTGRARRVQAHLQSLGVPGTRFMEVRGVGPSECPAVPRTNPSCRKTDIFMFIFQGASLRNP